MPIFCPPWIVFPFFPNSVHKMEFFSFFLNFWNRKKKVTSGNAVTVKFIIQELKFCKIAQLYLCQFLLWEKIWRNWQVKSTEFCSLLSKGFAQNISVFAIQVSKKLVMVVQLFSWFLLSSRRWCEGSSRKSSRSHQHRRVLVVHCSQNIQILSKKIWGPFYAKWLKYDSISRWN